jgi:hypothetical protein
VPLDDGLGVKRKYRRPSATTSAAGVSQFLRRKGLRVVSCRSDTLEGEWVVLVNCHNVAEADHAYAVLREGGYALRERYAAWVVVKEKQWQADR